jgi:hypothetical protein
LLLLLLLGGAWSVVLVLLLLGGECWAALLLRWGLGFGLGAPLACGDWAGCNWFVDSWFVGSWHCRLQVHIALRTKLLNSC